MSIRIVIADDHQVVRAGIRKVMTDSGLEVVHEAADGQEALDFVKQSAPDVVLLDMRMPNYDGFWFLQYLREAGLETKVLVFSGFDNPTYVARCLTLGAGDYLLKSVSNDQLVESVKRLVAGEPPLEISQANRVRTVLSRRRQSMDDSIPLTKREIQVLRHIAFGLSNRDIATGLEISVETVKEHVQNILRKLNLTDRTQAAVWAVRRGLVE